MKQKKISWTVRVFLQSAVQLEVILAWALIAAVAMNAVNVVGRYVFGTTISGVDELQIYLLVALAFFGSVVASIRGQHLRMDVLTRFFPSGINRFLRGLEAVSVVVLCGFVCSVSIQYALRMGQIGTVSENAHIAMWIPHSVVALAFGALTLVGVAELLLRCVGSTMIATDPEQVPAAVEAMS